MCLVLYLCFPFSSKTYTAPTLDVILNKYTPLTCKLKNLKDRLPNTHFLYSEVNENIIVSFDIIIINCKKLKKSVGLKRRRYLLVVRIFESAKYWIMNISPVNPFSTQLQPILTSSANIKTT